LLKLTGATSGSADLSPNSARPIHEKQLVVSAVGDDNVPVRLEDGCPNAIELG
jgi:hypothetical protein